MGPQRAGHAVLDLINDVPAAAEIIERIVAEAVILGSPAMTGAYGRDRRSQA
jgi:hypothetical protein